MVLDIDENGTMGLRVSDRKNDTSNNFSVEVGDGGTPNQKFYFKVENLKLFLVIMRLKYQVWLVFQRLGEYQ